MMVKNVSSKKLEGQAGDKIYTLLPGQTGNLPDSLLRRRKWLEKKVVKPAAREESRFQAFKSRQEEKED